MDLFSTFECGQCFRFETFDDGKTYYGPLGDRIVKFKQLDANNIEVSSHNQNNLEYIVNKFLQTNVDYIGMQKRISVDDLMKKIVSKTDGLHLLKQDRLECFLSYFLSQCSNIPRIKKNLNTLVEKYGKEVEFENHVFRLFPTREDLKNTTELEFREMGFGYRAKYINKFIQDYPDFIDKEITDLNIFNKKLQKIEGIGQKVADCIQLFAYGDFSIFPVDTWIKKFMEKHYFDGKKTNNKQIRQKGQELFGEWAGYAEELIYHYARCYDEF